MKKTLFICLVLLPALAAWGQFGDINIPLDKGYERTKSQADLCFQTRDYACAKKNYTLALGHKADCAECSRRLKEIEVREAQLKKNREERLKQPKARPMTGQRTEAYYGTIKGLFDENDEKFDYQGFIKNGMPNGKGTADYNPYCKTCGQEYGTWVNGMREGEFKASYPSRAWYNATYKNNILDGPFTSNTVDGKKYEFYYRSGKKYGIQKIYDNAGRTEINSVNGELEGQATTFMSNGIKGVGYYKDGNFTGDCALYYESGHKVTLTIKDKKIIGAKVYFVNGNRFEFKEQIDLSEAGVEMIGTMFYKNGDAVTGIFDKAWELKDGKFGIVYSNGIRFDGVWKNGGINGKGIFNYKNDSFYSATFLNGVGNGAGAYLAPLGKEIQFCPKCRLYMGEFKNDVKHGQGKCYDTNSNLIYVGRFEDDKPIDEYPSGKKTIMKALKEEDILKKDAKRKQ